MNHRNLAVAAAVSALAFSSATLADGPGWTYIEGIAGLAETEGGIDGSNYRFGAGGSIQLAGVLHLSGSYTAGNLEVTDPFDLVTLDTDIDVYEIALGFHTGVTDNADVYAEAIFGNVDIDEIDDSDIYGGAFGVRVMVADAFEVNGGVEALEVDETENQSISAFIGGRYGFTENFSVGVTAKDSDVRYAEEDSLELDLRWTFGDPSWGGNN